MVELNSSFYVLSAATMCARWAKETPGGFLFDAKCHRLLSRHATKADALPADLHQEVELTDRDNVVLTPDLGKEITRRVLETLEPAGTSGQLWGVALADDAGLRAS